MPEINEIVSISEGIQYATSLYLNMEYSRIFFRKTLSNLCAFILP